MNRTLSFVALAAALSLPVLVPRSAHAADGTITYSGALTETTCTVTGGGAAWGTGNISVTLPDVSANLLASAGRTAGRTPFSLILGGGTRCTNGKTASLLVEASSLPFLDHATGALRSQVLNGARNVQIQLVNPANEQPINLAVNGVVANGDSVVAASNQPAATIVGNTATLNYVAQYLAAYGASTPGPIGAVLLYSMQYN